VPGLLRGMEALVRQRRAALIEAARDLFAE